MGEGLGLVKVVGEDLSVVSAVDKGLGHVTSMKKYTFTGPKGPVMNNE